MKYWTELPIFLSVIGPLEGWDLPDLPGDNARRVEWGEGPLSNLGENQVCCVSSGNLGHSTTMITVHLRSIPDTKAAIGWAGGHTVVVDRPNAKAGGQGLGFNGGELLALAIGGCFCNDLRYVAHDMGMALDAIAVDVSIDIDGNPPVVTGATIRVGIETEDSGADVAELLRRAKQTSTISNSVQHGFPVSLVEEI